MCGPCFLQQQFSVFEVLHEALRVAEIAHPFVEMVLGIEYMTNRKLVRRVKLEEKVQQSAIIKPYSRCSVIVFAFISESNDNMVLYFGNVVYKTTSRDVKCHIDATKIEEIE